MTEMNHPADAHNKGGIALTETEERLRLALKVGGQAWFEVNVQTGEVQVSPEYAGLIGFEPEHFETSLQNWMEHLHPDDRDGVMAAYQSCLATGGPATMEYRRQTSSGDWAWMRSIGEIVEWDDARKPLRMIGIHMNITKHKTADASFNENELRLELIISSANLGTWDWDMQTDQVLFNKHWAEMRGHRLDEIEPHASSWEKGINPDDLSALNTVLEKHLKGLTPTFSAEYRVRHKSGEWIWILDTGKVIERDDEGKPLRMVGIEKDITERKRAEASTQEEKRFSDALIRGLPDIFYLLDPQGNFLRWNDRTIELLGITSEEISKANALSFIHEDDRAYVAGKLQEAFEVGSATTEGRMLLKDTIATYLLTGTRLETSQGLSVIGVGIDITGLKKSEADLLASEEKYRTLFENMMDGFALHEMVYDAKGVPIDYIFLEANKAFGDLTGLDVTNIIGKKVTEVLPGTENDPADWIGRYGQVALSGTEIRFEQHAEALDKWFSVLAFSPAKGTFATIFEDITERKQAEEKVREKFAEIERMNSLMIGRELKMEELRQEIERLKGKEQ